MINNTRPFVLVNTGMTCDRCKGDRTKDYVADGGTEDPLKKEAIFRFFAFFYMSSYTYLYGATATSISHLPSTSPSPFQSFQRKCNNVFRKKLAHSIAWLHASPALVIFVLMRRNAESFKTWWHLTAAKHIPLYSSMYIALPRHDLNVTANTSSKTCNRYRRGTSRIPRHLGSYWLKQAGRRCVVVYCVIRYASATAHEGGKHTDMHESWDNNPSANQRNRDDPRPAKEEYLLC